MRGLFLLAIVALAGSGLAGCAGPGVRQVSSDINQSPNDHRQYRHVELTNGLQVLIVSDPHTDTAAASVVVKRGSYHEPDAFPGLAHLLQHVLPLASEKYPDLGGYEAFVSTHGGSSSEHTAPDHISYAFQVPPEHFREGLDRLAQFFISPVLDDATIEREKNAVDAEYRLLITDDAQRARSVRKAAFNPAHPASRFTRGRLDTFGPGVQEALRTFYEDARAANQLLLVVLTNEPASDAQTWIVPIFADIGSRPPSPTPEGQALFRVEGRPTVLQHVSLGTGHRVSYVFPVPPVDPNYREKPARYVTRLLNHRGAGSLHGQLVREGWIESLHAATERFDASNAAITVDVDLTEAGAGKIGAITDRLFAYIDVLRTSGPQSWRYEEQAKSAAMSFQYPQMQSPLRLLTTLATNLIRFPPQEVLTGPTLMARFDADLIQQYLDALSPENLLIHRSGPDLEHDLVSPWFDVPFSLSTAPIEVSIDEDVAQGLHPPPPNEFMPEDFAVLANDEAGPRKAVARPGLTLWLDTDTEFGAPRADVSLTLGVDGGLERPADIALAQMYRRLVNDVMGEYAHTARLAGVDYRLDITPAGFRIGLSGYADKQLALLDRFLSTFTQLEIDPARFAVHKEALLREWQDARLENPYVQDKAALKNLLLSSSWKPAILATALRLRGPDQLDRWRHDVLGAISVRGLLHGNVGISHAGNVEELLVASLPVGEFAVHRPEVVTVTQALRAQIAVDHDDASMVLYVQDPDSGMRARATSELTVHLIRQSYVNDLRTEQQLGYLVAATNRTLADRGGIAFIVQSPVVSSAALEQATRTFLDTRLAALESLTDPAFEAFKSGLIARITRQDHNLRERTARYLADLDLDITSFDSPDVLARAVGALTKPEMIDHIRALIARFDQQRVIVYSAGRFPDVPEAGRLATNTEVFKH